jgi:hypothetical protein
MAGGRSNKAATSIEFLQGGPVKSQVHLSCAVMLVCLLSCASAHSQNISVSPKLVPFPDQGIFSASSAYSVTLSNNQTGTLKITSIQTAAPYAQTNNCGSSLAPNAKCTINVTFSPTAVKYYSATLTITDSAANSPQVVSLTGNGVMPIKNTPAAGGFYFVHQIVNTPSTPQPVIITNHQSSAVTFTGVSSAAAFPITTNNCGDGHGGGTLAAGASCTVQVSFNPPAVTTYKANLTISHNAYGSPIVVPLNGTGISGTPPPGLFVTPPAPCLLPSQAQQFTAHFQGTGATSVFWYVDGILNGNATVGTVSASGFYTSPSTAGTHHVRAVSQSTSTLGGSSIATVTSTAGLVLDPYVASIPVNSQMTFKAMICSALDPNSISYTVDNIAGGNSTVGTISAQGVYTAPPAAGKHTVRLTDAALGKSTGGVVTVFSGITADFGSRANNTPVVPANMFGYGRAESLRTTSDRNLLTSAGVTEARLSAQITSVFATSTPDWTKIDPIISSIQAAGQHALLQLNQSPPWLQPTSGRCAGNSYSAPTDISQWTQMAKEYVAHLNTAFPGVVTDYEIWNEPNAAGMCSTDNLGNYMALYASAAPAMKAQSKTIRVGGPALSAYSSAWLTPFLTDSTTAPYVDFISYHQYFFGNIGLQVQWDKYTGNVSLYDAEQEVTTGAFGAYKRIQALAAAGKQVLTPIYITEYNTNWAFLQDCCKNHPIYAPVFNALYITDMLNSIYNGMQQVPNKIFYFAGSAYPYFCMIGVKDSNNDCLYSYGATPAPYPQYYAFDLLASPNNLGLSAGGHMAKSISTPTGGGGLATTAFYTASQDAVVIINPTSTAYSQIPVTFANPGLSGTQGMLYKIVGGTFASTTISFAVQGTSLTAPIDIPAYSVQAISLK